jgi:hypothetical protein
MHDCSRRRVIVAGARRRKIASGVATHYHHDEAGHLLAETSGTGVMKRIYVWADATRRRPGPRAP